MGVSMAEHRIHYFSHSLAISITVRKKLRYNLFMQKTVMENWRILLVPFLPLIFAYLELGGNWFGLRLVQRGPSVWSVAGVIIFSVAYSLVAAVVAHKFKFNLGLLMVNYGFGFSVVSIFLILNWGEIPEFSMKLVSTYPLLWGVAAIAIVGFLISGYLLVTAPPTV